MSPPAAWASASATYGPAAEAPYAAPAARAPRRMKALRVMPCISTPARMSVGRSIGSARQEGLDVALHVDGGDGTGEGPVGRDRLAEGRLDRRGVTALHRVDRGDQRQQVIALDAVDLPEVGARADALEPRTPLEDATRSCGRGDRRPG